MEDIDFIKQNNKEYYRDLTILEKTKDRVVCSIVPMSDTSRSVKVELTRQYYQVTDDSLGLLVNQKYETFEEVMEGIMGKEGFGKLLESLICKKLNAISDSQVE